MPVEFHLRSPVAWPIDVRGVLPSQQRVSQDALARQPIVVGNQRLPLADCFHVQVTGDGTDAMHVWCGDLSGVHGLAAELSHGTVRVEGPLGRHAGSRMSGGTLEIHGPAGDWVGAEMRGGRLYVHGDVGDAAGAAYHGSRTGMRGGELVVLGKAGREIATRMRRGLVVVCREAGELAAHQMLAGTLVLGDNVGPRLAAGMKRGTIMLWAPPPLSMRWLPTFRDGGYTRPVFVEILRRHLGNLGVHLAPRARGWKIVHGDLLMGGRGEILLPA